MLHTVTIDKSFHLSDRLNQGSLLNPESQSCRYTETLPLTKPATELRSQSFDTCLRNAAQAHFGGTFNLAGNTPDENLAKDASTPDKFPGFDCRRYNGSSGHVEHDVLMPGLRPAFWHPLAIPAARMRQNS